LNAIQLWGKRTFFRGAVVFFNPFAILLFLLLFLGLIFLFALVHVGLMTIAFEKIGFGPGQVFFFLLASLIGSGMNIPVKRIRHQADSFPDQVTLWGIKYRIPTGISHQTVIAVNVGGALIPMAVSIYLMFKWQLFFQPLLGILAVSAITYHLARPIPGLGIALPLFIPPLLAALVSLLISTTDLSPVVAYISGTIGTLVGADILHYKDIGQLNTPVASIGGAGTFDGIFLTGIIAVLLA